MPFKITDELSIGFRGICPVVRLKNGFIRDGVRVGNVLHCDDCGKNVRLKGSLTASNAKPHEEVRAMARAKGWSQGVGTDDFCPDCTNKAFQNSVKENHS